MPAKGKYDLDVSLSHGTPRQNKRRGLKIQQKKLRKEGDAQSKKIKRIGYAEKAAKAAIAIDTVAGVVTGTALARQAGKAVAKKAATLIINKGSKFGARTSKSQAKDIVNRTVKNVHKANKKKAKGGGAGKRMDKTRTPEVKGRDPVVPKPKKKGDPFPDKHSDGGGAQQLEATLKSAKKTKNASNANTAADRRKLGIKNKSADFVEKPGSKLTKAQLEALEKGKKRVARIKKSPWMERAVKTNRAQKNTPPSPIKPRQKPKK